ncbi:MAG: hypothetical protein J2P48_13655, partial [Alphaproteobacteria bacterium]|nr:hypothetical protein [Alphaproteobacteria bacterium]
MSEAASCSGSPGRRSGGARAHRWVHRLATAVGAFAAALFLVAAAGLWRLTQGPISLDLVTPYIQEALNRSDRGPRIAVSGGRIGIDRQTHQLNLWMEGVRLTQSDGEPLAVFPAVSAAFGLRSFLHGTLAPTRLVIERPVLRLVRNETGTIRLRFGDQHSDASSFGPEILAQLAGQREQGAPFGLMRRVIVRDATFVLDDRQTGRRWRADHVDAAVERAPEGYAGDLSLTVPLGGRTPEFHASYRYSSAQRTLDVALEIHAIEPAALASFAPELAPLAAANFPVSGTVVTRLNLAELKSEGLRVDLHLGKGSIKSELLPGGLLAVQEGTVRAVYAPETGELRLARLALDLGDGSAISFAGTLSGVTPAMVAGRGLRAKSIPGKLAIVLANVPVNKFESLWPPALSRGGRRWVLDNIHDGMLDEAAVQLDLDVNAATRSAEVVSAHGTMRYHDATITYLPGLTPAQKVSGTARLQDKRLIFTPTGGTVKSVHVTGGSLEISDLGAPVEWLTVDIPFAGPIQDVLETIDAKPLGYAHAIGIDPAGVAGRAEARIHFKLPLLKDLKLDQIAFAAKANLTGAGIAKVAMNRNLTDGNFALVITRPGAHLQGSSRFDGVPLNIDAHLFFKPKDGERARYRIGLTLNDEQRRRLGFDFIPDRLSGPAAIDLLYRTLDPAHARAEATVDLQSTSLSIPEAGWKKPPGAPAMARLSLDLYNERISRLREIAVKAAGLDARFAVALTPDAQQMARIDIQRFAVG